MVRYRPCIVYCLVSSNSGYCHSLKHKRDYFMTTVLLMKYKFIKKFTNLEKREKC